VQFANLHIKDGDAGMSVIFISSAWKISFLSACMSFSEIQ
jgi:hypothetical protein